jgi:hypothetical protein
MFIGVSWYAMYETAPVQHEERHQPGGIGNEELPEAACRLRERIEN